MSVHSFVQIDPRIKGAVATKYEFGGSALTDERAAWANLPDFPSMFCTGAPPRGVYTARRTAGTARTTPKTRSAGRAVAGHAPKVLPIVIGSVIAILIGLALPVLAVALYLCLGVYLVAPFRGAARVRFRRL